jgi:hypothetical protein
VIAPAGSLQAGGEELSVRSIPNESDSMNQAFDLSSLSEALGKDKKYRAISKAIQVFASARSYALDLESARAALIGLIEIDQLGASIRVTVGQALMVHAVMFYCRAAIEHGNARSRIGITADYSPAQAKMHKDVVSLRNTVIAHLDIGEGKYGRDWVVERAILKVSDGSGTFSSVWVRRNYKAELTGDLLDLCEAGLSRVNKIGEERRQALASEFSRMLAEDPQFRGLVESYPFSPEEFFPADQSVEQFWQNRLRPHETYEPRMMAEGSPQEDGPAVHTDLSEQPDT